MNGEQALARPHPSPLPQEREKSAVGRAYRPVLVDLNCAAMVLETPPAEVTEMAEEGRLRNVFDIGSRRATRRDLRFDLGELMRRHMGMQGEHGPDWDDIDRLVGKTTQAWLHTESVCAVLQVRRQTVHTWLRRRELRGLKDGHRQMVERASLVEFLERRRV